MNSDSEGTRSVHNTVKRLWINIADVYKTLLIVYENRLCDTFLCVLFFETNPLSRCSCFSATNRTYTWSACLFASMWVWDPSPPQAVCQGESAAGHQLMLTSAPCQLTALWDGDLNTHQPHTYNLFPFLSVSLSLSLALWLRATGGTATLIKFNGTIS